MVMAMKTAGEFRSDDVTAVEETAALQGQLRAGAQAIPVWVRHASKYSAAVTAIDDSALTPGDYDALTLALPGDEVSTGHCRLLIDPSLDGTALRLVALEGIVDFEKLLFSQRFDCLDQAARNVPLVLGYRRNLDAAFRDHVADLSYDLSVYRNLFDRLDEEYRHEPPAVAEALQQGIIEHLGPQMTASLDAYICQLPELTADFSGEQHGHHGYYLRKQIWGALLTSPFLARTNLKPRGYIGDSEMMQMCYRHQHEGGSTFGKLMHFHPVDAAAAQAVRNRRQLVPRLARQLADRLALPATERLKTLSVACGPAMELNDLFLSAEDCQRFHCSLLDQDQQALTEATVQIQSLEARFGQPLSVDLIQESVRTLLATRVLRARWGDFHFIYSMGLFDYLTPPVAEAVLRKLYALLLPGGEMVIGNFHVDNPTRLYMDYWMDWPLYYRTEQEFLDLASSLEGLKAWIDYDETGVQMLLRIRKADP